MKKLLLLFIMLFSYSGSWAQEETKEQTFPYTGQELDLDMEFGDVAIIKSWDKNEIYVKVIYEINDGETNEALELDIDDYRDRLSIDLDLDKRVLRKSRYDGCDRHGKRETYYNGDGYNVCADISVEIYLPKSADLFINTVVADVEVEGMEGDIEIETVTGHIDVSWAEDFGVDIRMKTVTGTVYTNFDLDRRKDRGLQLISSHDIKGTYKSGGKEITLETVTSDIYFRKQSTR